MIINARINSEEGEIFRLCEWSSSTFATNPTHLLQTDDLQRVKRVFSNITKIEIYVSNNLVASYTQYDTYGAISYDGQIFVQHENIFTDCMRVSLIRTSLVDEVNRLSELVEPVIDIDSMTVDEYRDYLMKQIGKQCRAEIYDGTQIQLPSTGAIEKYTYNDDDQRNLTNAMAILIVAPELPSVPYHPSGGMCRMIPAADLVTIYGTLQVRLTYLTTRCNFMNVWLRSITDKDQLLQINWDTELPEEYNQQVSEIYSQSLTIMNEIKNKFIPQEQEDEENEEINN